MKLSGQIFSYSAFNVLNAAVPFFLLPILTAYLLPEAFGMLSLVMMLQAMLLPIISVNFQGLVAIEYSKLSETEFRNFISSIIWLPISGFVLVFPLLYFAKGAIATLFNIPEFWVTSSAAFVLLQALPMLMPAIFQARQKVFAYGAYKIGMTVINVALSLLFIITLKYGWEGRMWGLLGALVIFNVASIIILLKQKLLQFGFDANYYKQAVRFGFPLIPHAVSGIMLAMADRLFLVNLASAESVGIYNVAYQISSALMIVMSSINQAWAPHLFSQLNSEPTLQQKQDLVMKTYKIMGVMLVGTILFVACLPVLYHLFIDKNYFAGLDVAVWIAVALLFQGFYFMVTNYIFYVKKTYLLSVMTLISAIVIMSLNYLLIPTYGMFGSAYAMLVSWSLLFVLAWWLAHRVYPMPWLSLKRGALK